jgi:Zn-dependent membrane protease YugP
MYFGFSGTHLLIILVSVIITGWAQLKVRKAYSTYQQMHTRRGLSGAQIAQSLLRGSDIHDVRVERTAGELTDHYDPRSKVLMLSDGVYGNTSVAAIGIAAHEVGHAIQDNQGFFPLAFRNSLVPVANLGSTLAWPLVIMGMLWGNFLLDLGILLFAGAVLFQVVTLPVEINASRRALALLKEGGYLQGEELKGASSVLTAAALTYIAAAAVALLNLLRLFLLRREE